MHRKDGRDKAPRRRGPKPGTRAEPRPVPPQAVLDECERRNKLKPRDFTAAFNGDPLPGYSAYDAKQRAEPQHEPPHRRGTARIAWHKLTNGAEGLRAGSESEVISP